MNDDIIIPKTQTTPAPSETDAAPNDTEEQDTVSDRVFDFSDGDIKPVTDLDGPVTHSVNLKIAEALRNPAATVNKNSANIPTGTSTPTTSSSDSIKKDSPGAWQSLSSQPINKLAPTPVPRSIPHPKIDSSMQTPAVKVYSQIPHHEPPQQVKPAPQPAVRAPYPPNTPNTPSQPTRAPQTTQPIQAQSVQPTKPITRPVVDVPLQEVLKRAYSRSQNHPPIPEENLLDKKIGTFEATPFAPAQSSQKTSAANYREPIGVSDQMPVPAKILPEKQNPNTRPIPMQTAPVAGPNTSYREPISDSPIPSQHDKSVPIGNTTKLSGTARPYPSNPPTKTVGNRMSEYTEKDFTPNTPKILQDEVSNVLPTNLEEKKIKQQTPTVSDAKNEFLKPLRTYEGDIAEVMSHRRTSTASIAIAETRKNEGQDRISNSSNDMEEKRSSSHIFLKLLMILVSIGLIGGGIYAGYYFYMKSPLAPTNQIVQPQQSSQASIIPVDARIIMPIDNQSPTAILARIRLEADKEQNPDTIREIIFTAKDTTGTVSRVAGPNMTELMEVGAPDMLVRTLSADWMLGIYADPAGDKHAFVAVTTDFFQNAFAGMLQWEQVMADDLKNYVGTVRPIDIIVSSATSTTLTASSTLASASSTAQTTPAISTRSYASIRRSFQDRIVMNKDVRAFRTTDGETVFLYSFIDNTHLVITDTEATLAEILTRLEKKALIR
jgi:hypothetical protein